LGLLNYIRIWHDNSGEGSSASWFLKYIIVQDLQTMEKFYFIGQRWFAVEKEDGLVNKDFYSFIYLIFLLIRLNVFYQLLMKLKNMNFLMYYQKKPIVFLMVIYGFQSFLIDQQINLLVFNDVLVVLFYYSVQCYLI
jgi:hypothetical protein